MVWGKENRLSRLLTSEKYFLLLALDHGLTVGPIEGLRDLKRWVEFAKAQKIPGVVLNKGMVSSLSPLGDTSLVLQTFGLPDQTNAGTSKVPVARVEDAVRLSADAISVQINFKNPDLPQVAEKISAVVSSANEVSLPVLFMINVPNTEVFDTEDLAFAIRVCSELGADLIKVPLPAASVPFAQLDDLREVIDSSPPVLLAGGALSGNFEERAKMAVAAGFKGVCVGRHVFQADEPELVLQSIEKGFLSARSL
ncbi:hypothetical protein MYX82_03880 [Acidobacteria bacterium AH-259-D05]|nr:hypothetical protein [Acidobacteria bacterium AH-259-D05]